MSNPERGREPAPRHLPVARLSAAAALAVGAYLVVHERSELHWRAIAPGIEFATMRGEPWCRQGSSAVAVLRIDPARATIRVAHFSLTERKRPLNIVEWQRETGAVAVFNAGQFYPDLSYMGMLVSSGHMVSNQPHPAFKAALVADPILPRGGTATRTIRVLDLTHDSINPRAPAWRELAQSFMVVDRDGNVRVRKSDHVANRTLVAEDRRGRLLVITTEGGYTLWDFAALLKHSPLAVSLAMAMDGGWEAELCVRTRDFRYASFGRWEASHENSDAPGARALLPVVIAVESR